MSHPLSRPRFVAEYFRDVEGILAAHHAVAPRQHGGDKGEDREAFLAATLNNHLPAVARAHRGGTVIDSLDSRSGQTDIVIYSSWSPLLAQQRKPFFFAEGTFAAIEVKSTLTTRALRDAQEACIRLKRLRKFTRPHGENAILTFGDTAGTIAVGIFAFSSRLRDIEALHDLLMELHKDGIKNTEMLDFVCVNQQYSLRRRRSEDVAAVASSDPQETLEHVRASCYYSSSPYAFAGMLEAILDHVSYMGPFHGQIGQYLHHWSRGLLSTWREPEPGTVDS